jgi:chromosome segregation ATPase
MSWSEALTKVAPLFVFFGTIITVLGGIIIRRIQSQIDTRNANISAEKELRDDLLELVKQNEQRIESCEKRLEARDAKINHLQTENDTLHTENITLKLRIIDLERSVNNLTNQLSEFTSKVYYKSKPNGGTT